MLQQRYQRVEELFHAMLEHGSDASLPEDNPELVAEARALNESYRAWSAGLHSPPEEPLPRFGPYTCDEILGAGGMGTVYRAHRDDGQFSQTVAIKVLRGSLRLEWDRRRFLAERQILARLSHPHIARLLDGGMTVEGEPYLVMELVEGEPIDRYCDNRRLTVDQRIELFGQVLEAVDYAHRNLVVHRDLKPSNILVTAAGAVKVLDFGTSKLLEEDSTTTALHALTPRYASPEQLRGEPAGVPSDVYSSGIVLYELLAGKPPFGETRSYASSLESAIRETAPPLLEKAPEEEAAEARSTSLSDLRKRLRGDLASILTKAPAYDSAQRYPSVASFAEDLERHRDKRPVLARRQNWSYVFGSAVRRHARAAAVAALLVIGLSGAALYSARQARLAQREAVRAQAANRFLAEVFQRPMTDSASRHDLTVRELLQLAEKRVRPVLGADPAAAADVEVALAGGLYWQGETRQARALLDRALHHSRAAKDVPRQAQVTASISLSSMASNQFDQAWKEALEALALWKEHADRFSPPLAVGTLHDAGTTLLSPADSVHRQYFERAVELARRYPDQVPASALGACLQKLGESYINVDRRYQDAYPILQEAVAIHRSDPTRLDLLLASLQSFGRANRFLRRYAKMKHRNAKFTS
jgi:serine/threonine-protein kinase